MKTAAIIVTYNRLSKLRLAIDKTLTQAIDYVVVVNNHSNDGTQEYLDGLDDTRLKIQHLEENTGGAGGFYYGCKYACENLDADWLLLFDDDAYPAPDLIAKFSALDLPPNVGAVNASVLMPNDEIADFNRPAFNPFRSPKQLLKYLFSPTGHYFKKDLLKHSQCLSVDLSTFVGLFVRADLARGELGYPRKEFFLYCDDWTYTLKITKLGYKNLYFSDLVFYHDSQTNLLNKQNSHTQVGASNKYDAQLWKKYYNYRNSIYFYKYAAGLFFPLVLALKLAKWIFDVRYYKKKLEYFRTLFKALIDGLNFKG